MTGCHRTGQGQRHPPHDHAAATATARDTAGVRPGRRRHGAVPRSLLRDRGSATVWAVTGVAVLMTALLMGLHVSAAVLARHRAEAAADLAALAAAGLAVEGAQAACGRAGEIAAAMDGTVVSCRLEGWDVLVEVRVPIAIALPGMEGAAGRARAGPAPTASDG